MPTMLHENNTFTSALELGIAAAKFESEIIVLPNFMKFELFSCSTTIVVVQPVTRSPCTEGRDRDP